MKLPFLFENKYVLIISIGLLGLLMIAIGLQNQPNSLRKNVQPSPYPSDESITPIDNPPVEDNIQQTKKMMDFIDNRRPLSRTDQQARNKLITKTNPLQETADFSAEYVSAPDEFMVEIRTKNLDKAKKEAAEWFQNQGFSNEGICHLPIVFYINYEIAQSLRGMHIQFDPLPPGC